MAFASFGSNFAYHVNATPRHPQFAAVEAMAKAGGWAGCGSPREGDEEKEELHLQKSAKVETVFLFFKLFCF